MGDFEYNYASTMYLFKTFMCRKLIREVGKKWVLCTFKYYICVVVVHYVLSANEHQAEKLSLGFTFRVGSCAIDFQTESILAQK